LKKFSKKYKVSFTSLELFVISNYNNKKNTLMKGNTTKAELDMKFNDLKISIMAMDKGQMEKLIGKHKRDKAKAIMSRDRLVAEGNQSKQNEIFELIDIVNYHQKCIYLLSEAIEEQLYSF